MLEGCICFADEPAMGAKVVYTGSPTYLLLSAIIARPLHARLMSWLGVRRTRQASIIAIGHVDQRAALALARRLAVLW